MHLAQQKWKRNTTLTITNVLLIYKSIHHIFGVMFTSDRSRMSLCQGVTFKRLCQCKKKLGIFFVYFVRFYRVWWFCRDCLSIIYSVRCPPLLRRSISIMGSWVWRLLVIQLTDGHRLCLALPLICLWWELFFKWVWVFEFFTFNVFTCKFVYKKFWMYPF